MGPIATMLGGISSICFFVQTTYWESETHFGEDLQNPIQGLSQGNSVAPGTWVIASSTMIHKQRAVEVSNTILDAISRVVFTFAVFQ